MRTWWMNEWMQHHRWNRLNLIIRRMFAEGTINDSIMNKWLIKTRQSDWSRTNGKGLPSSSPLVPPLIWTFLSVPLFLCLTFLRFIPLRGRSEREGTALTWNDLTWARRGQVRGRVHWVTSTPTPQRLSKTCVLVLKWTYSSSTGMLHVDIIQPYGVFTLLNKCLDTTRDYHVRNTR